MIRGEAIATRFCRLRFPLRVISQLCAFFPTMAAHAWNGQAGSHRQASATRRRLDCSKESLRADSKLSPTDSPRQRFDRARRCCEIMYLPNDKRYDGSEF